MQKKKMSFSSLSPFLVHKSIMSLIHTGKCIRRFGGIFRVLPVLHRPEVVDIGVNTI